jgi:(1->4)-alpha-D-glucan 1-alpha-D-glucosylmutase
MNLDKKTDIDGMLAPTRNDEYLLYQVLLGSHPVMPAPREELDAFTERIAAYMQKATREAKQHTSWANPNEAYERATEKFVRALLEERAGNAFVEDLRAALKPVTWLGFLNGLSMVTVKLTSPGVPDTYQGNEIWDFSLVDPDNRRPVDYARRQRMLQELQAMGEPSDAALAEILANLHDGRAKLYVLWRLLQLRRAREALFQQGGYAAVRISGERGKHLVAFARRHGGEACITVAPRLIAGLGITPGVLPCGELWGDARIDLPFLKDGSVVRDVLSGREHTIAGGGLAVAALLATFPTAVLVAGIVAE